MKRIISVILIPLLTAFSCGPNLRSNDIESVTLQSSVGHNLLTTNAEVDQMALDLSAFLNGKGFKVTHTSRSFGVKPWTGHTQDVYLRLADNERVLALISISKCCIETTFRELETEIGSETFAATPEQLRKVRELGPLVESFIRSRLEGSDRPNKSFNPTPDNFLAGVAG